MHKNSEFWQAKRDGLLLTVTVMVLVFSQIDVGPLLVMFVVHVAIVALPFFLMFRRHCIVLM